MATKKQLINQLKKSENWPFDDPNYICRIQEKKYKKVLSADIIDPNGDKSDINNYTNVVTVDRVKTKHSIPISELHPVAMNGISCSNTLSPVWHGIKPPLAKYELNKSPYNARGKWIRPKAMRVWTKGAVELIKEGLINLIINPITHKVKAAYVKTILQFPQ